MFLRGPFLLLLFCFICSFQGVLDIWSYQISDPQIRKSHWTDYSSKVRIRSIYCPTGSWCQLQEQVAMPFKFNSWITVAIWVIAGTSSMGRCCVGTRRGCRQLLSCYVVGQAGSAVFARNRPNGRSFLQRAVEGLCDHDQEVELWFSYFLFI